MTRCATILMAWVLLQVASTGAAAQSSQQNQAYEELQRKYEAACKKLSACVANLKPSSVSARQRHCHRQEGLRERQEGTFCRRGMRTLWHSGMLKLLQRIRRLSQQHHAIAGPISSVAWRTPNSAMRSRHIRT